MTQPNVEPDELEDDTIDTGEDDIDTPEPYIAPSEAEWQRTQEALKKANAQAKQYRLAARGQSTSSDPARDVGETAAETEKELAKARAEAIEEAEKTWKPRLVKAHALAAFAAAGAKSPERMARLLDLDSITFDDDGNPEGLDDQVDELKTDMPELFEKQRSRGPSAPRSVDGGPRTPGAPKKLSATERQLQNAGLL